MQHMGAPLRQASDMGEAESNVSGVWNRCLDASLCWVKFRDFGVAGYVVGSYIVQGPHADEHGLCSVASCGNINCLAR